MAQFLITYDLHNRRRYTELYQLLASWDAVRLTESNWLANLKGPAPVIRDIVAGTLDNDDTVAILELEHGSDWATLRVQPAAEAWLSHNITPAQKAA
jgi:hypothetical protein